MGLIRTEKKSVEDGLHVERAREKDLDARAVLWGSHLKIVGAIENERNNETTGIRSAENVQHTGFRPIRAGTRGPLRMACFIPVHTVSFRRAMPT